jgi:hypothetical protein
MLDIRTGTDIDCVRRKTERPRRLRVAGLRRLQPTPLGFA